MKNNEEVLKRWREEFTHAVGSNSKYFTLKGNVSNDDIEQFLISELNRREREIAEEMDKILSPLWNGHLSYGQRISLYRKEELQKDPRLERLVNDLTEIEGVVSQLIAYLTTFYHNGNLESKYLSKEEEKRECGNGWCCMHDKECLKVYSHGTVCHIHWKENLLPCGCPKNDEYSMCINQEHLKK